MEVSLFCTFTYLYLSTYPFPIFEGEHHFYNYPNKDPVSKSHKELNLSTTTIGYQRLQVEERTSSKELAESVCPQALISF